MGGGRLRDWSAVRYNWVEFNDSLVSGAMELLDQILELEMEK